ncbi:MAG: c-type cytochrome [Blastocatellia bacterium]|nr:c-type cytochrome [Blastocatellia bacterium]
MPNSDGVEVVRDKCVVCHEADLIVQQRLDRAGWKREIGKMVRWGTKLTDAETEKLADYLALHFGKTKAGASVGLAAKGEAVFLEKCLTCHEADLTEQQQLSKAGWEREVGKMVRWGAQVSEEEKPALVEFLTGKYGVR